MNNTKSSGYTHLHFKILDYLDGFHSSVSGQLALFAFFTTVYALILNAYTSDSSIKIQLAELLKILGTSLYLTISAALFSLLSHFNMEKIEGRPYTYRIPLQKIFLENAAGLLSTVAIVNFIWGFSFNAPFVDKSALLYPVIVVGCVFLLAVGIKINEKRTQKMQKTISNN